MAYCIASVALLGLAVPSAAQASASSAAKGPTWITGNAKTKTATLTIIAAYKGGFDFDGYSKGQLVISVPVGYKVNVIFSNHAQLAHSVVFTSYAARTSASGFAVAFKGASSPAPTSGVTGSATQKFSFTASKVGTYAIVCAVPGHALAGMWDVLKVVKSGAPAVTIGM